MIRCTVVQKFGNMFSCFYTVHTCDEQTHRQTDRRTDRTAVTCTEISCRKLIK